MAGYVVAVAALAWATASPWQQLHRGVRSFDLLVAATAAAGAWACLVWLTVGFMLTALATVPGAAGRWCAVASARLAPAAVRRLACVVLGGVVVSGVGALPEATAHSPDVPVATASALPDLDRPAGAGRQVTAQATQPVSASPPRAGSADEPASDAVVVRPGDTLWGIAADHLPAGASDAEIATTWPRWYQANRRVIGADPDLILPGQRLREPTQPSKE